MQHKSLESRICFLISEKNDTINNDVKTVLAYESPDFYKEPIISDCEVHVIRIKRPRQASNQPRRVTFKPTQMESSPDGTLRYLVMLAHRLYYMIICMVKTNNLNKCSGP